MAKRRTTALASVRPSIVVVGGAGGRRRSIGRRVRRAGRRLARRAKHAALPTTSLAIGGALAGYVEGRGLLNAIPTIGGSRSLTMGLVGYGVTRVFKNKWAKAAGLALLITGAYDFGKKQAGGSSGWDADGWGDGGDGGGSY